MSTVLQFLDRRDDILERIIFLVRSGQPNVIEVSQRLWKYLVEEWPILYFSARTEAIWWPWWAKLLKYLGIVVPDRFSTHIISMSHSREIDSMRADMISNQRIIVDGQYYPVRIMQDD